MAAQTVRRVLVTGANRGLGSEFVRQYAQDGWEVIACMRNPSDHELGDISKFPGKIHLTKLEPTDDRSVKQLGIDLKGTPIDIFISNAGLYPRESEFGEINYFDWMETFKVHVMSPMHLIETLIDNITTSELKTLVFMSSTLGSFGKLTTKGGSYQYRTSKTALNMMAKALAVDLKPKNVKVLIFHPGHVPTRMGKEDGTVDIVASIQGMKRIIHGTKFEECGKFVQYDGSEIPW